MKALDILYRIKEVYDWNVKEAIAELEQLQNHRKEIKLLGDRVEFTSGEWTHNQPILDFLRIHFDVVEVEERNCESCKYVSYVPTIDGLECDCIRSCADYVVGDFYCKYYKRKEDD